MQTISHCRLCFRAFRTWRSSQSAGTHWRASPGLHLPVSGTSPTFTSAITSKVSCIENIGNFFHKKLCNLHLFTYSRIKTISGYAFAGSEHIEMMVINDNPVQVSKNYLNTVLAKNIYIGAKCMYCTLYNVHCGKKCVHKIINLHIKKMFLKI